MDIFFLFVLLALFHPVLPFPTEEPELLRDCPKFRCGNSDEIGFPFTTNTQNAACGPFVLEGCDKEEEEQHQQKRIQLVRGPSKWYQLESISCQNPLHCSVSFTDTELQMQLNTTNCTSFIKSSLPRTHYDPGIELIPNQCYQRVDSISSPHSDLNHKHCPEFRVDYTDVNTGSPTPPPLPKCSSFQLPLNISSSPHDNIFLRLTANFSFKVNVGSPCDNCPSGADTCDYNNAKGFHCIPTKDTVIVHLDCYHCDLTQGKCHYNKAGEFQCIHENDTSPVPISPHVAKGTEKDTDKPVCFESLYIKIQQIPCTYNNKLRLALGLGIGCTSTVPIILLLLFIIHRRQNRKGTSSNLLRANTDAFSKSDLEGASTFLGLSIFSYTQLEEATINFASENELGDGGFGTVYYGKLQDGREVAVKRLYERNYSKVKQFLNEIEILTQLRHPNLVSLYGCTSRRSRELLLVYEYIPNGTVADHLHGERANSSPLTWPIRMRIAIETASALVYLHASDIIHRDVKTNNILLDRNFVVKVADFGISRLFPNDVTHILTAPQGTPGYVDPEYYHCYQLTEKSDVYSFGVVLVELISSMLAVDISRDRHEINLAKLAINRIQKCAFDELIDPFLGYQSDEEVRRMTTSVAELAFLCLQQDKEMRPTMDEVLEELNRIESGEYESDNIKDEEEPFDS